MTLSLLSIPVVVNKLKRFNNLHVVIYHARTLMTHAIQTLKFRIAKK